MTKSKVNQYFFSSFFEGGIYAIQPSSKHSESPTNHLKNKRKTGEKITSFPISRETKKKKKEEAKINKS